VKGALDKFATITKEVEQYAHIGNGADFPS
jgi:hypothetical protein